MKVILKAARVNAGLKQREVADMLGVTVDRIKYLESEEGGRKISYEDLLKFCAVYKCTPDDISLSINYPKSEVV